MLPTTYDPAVMADMNVLAKAVGEFHVRTLLATKEIFQNNVSACTNLAGTRALRETCIRNIEAITRIWEPFVSHPTT